MCSNASITEILGINDNNLVILAIIVNLIFWNFEVI